MTAPPDPEPMTTTSKTWSGSGASAGTKISLGSIGSAGIVAVRPRARSGNTSYPSAADAGDRLAESSVP